mmetsp:Transcript_10926/g.31028  ORF Transcript_10926/g.31028 Transcript_10926/m.31028 type:complete len:213 (-) Transcript_10926:300-938(-)
MSDAASVLAYACAKGNWMPWFWPIGLPNTSRSRAYAVARSRKNRASPRHSEAMRIRSAFMELRIYLKPSPSMPMRLLAGMRRSSKKIWQVLWLIMVSMGWIENASPWRLASRRSTKNVLRALRRGVLSSPVRASSRSRSLCSARLVHSLVPLIMYSSPSRRAVVLRLKVSVPESGSLTPKAWSRSSPEAIFGRNSSFCASLPCRSTVPMVYI